MNANQMIDKLTRVEVNGQYAPDCRRVIMGERFAVRGEVRRSGEDQSGDGRSPPRV